jgi:hypothetical protein
MWMEEIVYKNAFFYQSTFRKYTMDENEKVVVSAAVARERGKILVCVQAFKLSREHNISLKKIGGVSNRDSIKIVSYRFRLFRVK